LGNRLIRHRRATGMRQRRDRRGTDQQQAQQQTQQHPVLRWTGEPIERSIDLTIMGRSRMVTCHTPNRRISMPDDTLSPPLQHTRLHVEGMHCASCVGQIEAALKKVPGVLEASVNLATETAEVNAEDSVRPAQLIQAITDAGYTVPAEQVTLDIEGMHCASCIGRVQQALEAVPGVLEANV